MGRTPDLHQGHRDRLKERFRQKGLDGFAPVNVLELLLFFCIPQGDTNVLAHELLDRFGSLSQVLEAPVEELEKVKGVGKHASTLLSLVPALSRYYLVSRNEYRDILTTTDACGEYLMDYFVGQKDEVVYLLCLDSKCKVLCCKEVARGNVNSAGISIRRIVEIALSVNAVSVVLSHNHPGGLAVPSNEDILTTRRVAVALDAVGIVLADHIVVADDDFVSMVQSDFYSPDACRLIV